MNFRQYFDRIAALGRTLQSDSRFRATFESYPPFSDADFRDLEQALADEGLKDFHIWKTFQEFYSVVDGFILQWEYVGSEPLACRTGSARIAMIPQIYMPEDLPSGSAARLFDEPRVLDAVSPDDFVAVRFYRDRDAPGLHYFSDKTRKYHRLSLDFEGYLSMLLESRATYEWQHFFVDDPAFPRSPENAERFQNSLKHLFPDANASLFSFRAS